MHDKEIKELQEQLIKANEELGKLKIDNQNLKNDYEKLEAEKIDLKNFNDELLKVNNKLLLNSEVKTENKNDGKGEEPDIEKAKKFFSEIANGGKKDEK